MEADRATGEEIGDISSLDVRQWNRRQQEAAATAARTMDVEHSATPLAETVASVTTPRNTRSFDDDRGRSVCRGADLDATLRKSRYSTPCGDAYTGYRNIGGEKRDDEERSRYYSFTGGSVTDDAPSSADRTLVKESQSSMFNEEPCSPFGKGTEHRQRKSSHRSWRDYETPRSVRWKP